MTNTDHESLRHVWGPGVNLSDDQGTINDAVIATRDAVIALRGALAALEDRVADMESRLSTVA
jgi:hypothetical protein